LIEVLNTFLEPIRAKRKELEKDTHAVMRILQEGTEKVRDVAASTMNQVRHAIKLDYF
jgi:tryptophanyl-tRNA synthetase